jgi:hypothetical protein
MKAMKAKKKEERKKAMKAKKLAIRKRNKRILKKALKTMRRMKKAMKALNQQVASLQEVVADMQRRMIPPEPDLFEESAGTPPQQELVLVYLWHVQRPLPDVTNMMIDPNWTVEHTKNMIRINEGYGDDVQLSLITDNGDVMQDDLPLAAYDILSDEIIRVDARPLP